MKHHEFTIIMLNLTKVLFASGFAITLYGCANSASHQVLTRENAGDEYLSCSEIKMEKRKAKAVIQGVNRDKNDMTGADVMDGILWFPFNVIAKQSNYSSAIDAANGRIDELTLIEVERGCRTHVASNRQSDDLYVQKLSQLNSLYKSGLLTEEEYKSKKTLVLESFDKDLENKNYNNNYKPRDEVAQRVYESNNPPKHTKLNVGQHWYQAEQIAKQSISNECTNIKLINSESGKDIYSGDCPLKQVIISCQWRQCRVLQ